MISAKPTCDEDRRIQALHDYQILDTEFERVFDDLTQLASDICRTPIALISLVDVNRQWFKSRHGIDAEETSRDIAFCAHAIHERKVFEVANALEDERFRDNPLVTGAPNIRFYAGAQLLTPSGHAIGTLCAIDDKPKTLTSEQKNALEILARQVISQMELRIKMKELEQASENKTIFLSNISHELRTPLNAIINFSQLVQKEIEKSDVSNVIRNYMDKVTYSGQRLFRVINTTLDISKIEAGKMELAENVIDTRSFFDDLLGMVTVVASQKGVNLSMEYSPSMPLSIIIDDTKLSQVLINLLNNAIKFTPSGKKITLVVSPDEDKLHLCISDQGQGISFEDQEKLFTPFQQAASAQSEGGTGLGLAISKGFVELMGGSITLRSELNIGTDIDVILPLKVPTEISLVDELPLDISNTPDYSQNRKILVVEDDLINQEVAKAIFDSLGFQIEIAGSAEEGIEKINQSLFDLVFMDIQLPGMTGIEATQILKKSHPTIPIVALTADIFQEKSLFDGFLTKPIEPENIVKVINTL